MAQFSRRLVRFSGSELLEHNYADKTSQANVRSNSKIREYHWINSSGFDLLRLIGRSKSDVDAYKYKIGTLIIITNFLKSFLTCVGAFSVLGCMSLFFSKAYSYVNMYLLLCILCFFSFLVLSALHACHHMILKTYSDFRSEAFIGLGIDVIDARIRYKDPKNISVKLACNSTLNNKLNYGDYFDCLYEIDKLTKQHFFRKRTIPYDINNDLFNSDNLVDGLDQYSDSYLQLRSEYKNKGIDLDDDLELKNTFSSPELIFSTYHFTLSCRLLLASLICLTIAMSQAVSMWGFFSTSSILDTFYTVALCCLGSTLFVNVSKPKVISSPSLINTKPFI